MVEPKPDTVIPEGFFNVNVYRARPVVVVDGAKTYRVDTAVQSPRLIAEAAGVKLYREDDFTVSNVTDFAADGTVGQKVVIDRAMPITILSNGVATTARTQQKTVKAVLAERDVALGPKDTVVTPVETAVTPGMTIRINRVTVVTQQQVEVIPFAIETIKDASLEAGTTQVRTEGTNGSKTSTYRIHFTNGHESARELLGQQVTAKPVGKVVVVGTKIDYSANPVELGKQMAAARGWTGSEWDALYRLWMKESGWNPASRNVFSGACGIPQAYPCSKITDKSTAGQISWGLSYIAGKYGTPSNAWAYWLRNNSY